jgi:hypothetical protein
MSPSEDDRLDAVRRKENNDLFAASSSNLKTMNKSSIKKSKNTTKTIENNPTTSVELVVHSGVALNDALNKSGSAVVNDNGDAPSTENCDSLDSPIVIEETWGDHSGHELPETVEHELSEAALQDALTKLSGDDAIDEEVMIDSSSLKVVLFHILREQTKISLFLKEISKKTSKKNLLLTVSNSFSHNTIWGRP